LLKIVASAEQRTAHLN